MPADRRPARGIRVVVLAALLATACGTPDAGAPYLYVWAGDEQGGDTDFLAVYDVRPSSPGYGSLITTVPAGVSGGMPHHLEYRMPAPGGLLFANDHFREVTVMFDLRDPRKPVVAGRLPPAPPLRFPHDFIRIPNGNVLVSFLRSDGPSPLPGDSTMPGGHGGVAEYTADGKLVRWRSAADSTIPVPIRPYAFALLPEHDRFVVTSAAMMEDTSAAVVQVWRLSDLTLLRTLTVPDASTPDGAVLPGSADLPFEPRRLSDGSIFFNSYRCGFYRLIGVETESPRIVPVHAIPTGDGKGGCGVPWLEGRYWLMPVGRANSLVTLDLADPASPREIQRLVADSSFRPHWVAYDSAGRRLVVGAENGGETRMLIATFDPVTGRLAWDDRLRTESGLRGISFERPTWPHGATGPAFGHAALFGH